MRPRRILLFSGMGGDSRLFEKLSLDPFRLVAPEYPEPHPHETLVDYAERIADANGVGCDDIVGGASFGGMIAAEIARRRRVAGLILLASTLRPERLPMPFRWMCRAEGIVPDFVLDLRRWRPLVRWRFSSPTPEAEACIRAMAIACPLSRLRAFGRMLGSWRGLTRPPCPFLSVHGARDRMIPLDSAEPSSVLEDAGHALTLTHAGETTDAILDFASRITGS